jgi:hypothetical protein
LWEKGSAEKREERKEKRKGKIIKFPGSRNPLGPL